MYLCTLKAINMPFTWTIWEQEAFLTNCDVAIIGSGIVGLQTAISLRERFPTARVVVLEREPFPRGASTRNAGFACFGSLSELLDDLKEQTLEEVLVLVERRIKGLRKLRQQLGESTIQFEGVGGYEVFRPGDQALFAACQEIQEEFNHHLQAILGEPETYQIADAQIQALGLAGVDHLILNKAEGQIHSGKMMRALLKRAHQVGVETQFGMEVKEIHHLDRSVEIEVQEGGVINAKYALVATNGFAPQLVSGLAVRPVRNQVLVTEPVPNLALRGTFHYDRGYVYFRNVGDRVLLGGGRHWAGKVAETDQAGLTDYIQDRLEQLLQEIILPGQNIPISHRWSGILGVGPEKKPILEMLGPRVGVAVRLGGMGVALGHLLGEEAADLLSPQLAAEL
jgi:gamma-glutamylputrescine oxidase